MAKYYGDSTTNPLYRGVLTVTEEAVDFEANTSTVSVSFKVYRSDGASSSYHRAYNNHASMVINGQTYSYSDFEVDMSGATSEALAATLFEEEDIVIPHDENGQKVFNIVATYFNDSSSSIGSEAQPLTVSGIFACTPTLKSSTVTAVSVPLGKGIPLAIHINRSSDTLTHYLTYSFNNGAKTGVIASDVGTYYEWWLPSVVPTAPGYNQNEFINACPTTTAPVLTIECATLDEFGDQIGASTYCSIVLPLQYDLTINQPTASPIGVWQGVPLYVQNISKIQLTLGGSSPFGGEIVRWYLNGQALASLSQQGTVETAVITQSGTLALHIEAEDKRGVRQAYPVDLSITVQPYSPPHISNFKIFRCNSSGVFDIDGTYISVACDVSYDTLGGNNEYEVVAQYRQKDGGTYGTEIPMYPSPKAPGNAILIGGGNVLTSKTYVVRLTIRDGDLPTSPVSIFQGEVTVPSAQAFLSVDHAKGSIGLFGYPTHNNALDIPSDKVLYHGGHSIEEIADISISATGGYIKWSSGLIVAWKRVNVQNLPLTTSMSAFFRNDSAFSLGSLPTTFTNPPAISPQWVSNSNIAWVSDIVGASETSWGSAFVFAAESGTVSGSIHIIAVGV